MQLSESIYNMKEFWLNLIQQRQNDLISEDCLLCRKCFYLLKQKDKRLLFTVWHSKRQWQLTIFTWIRHNKGEMMNVWWYLKYWIHVLPKPGQPRRECQSSVACENSNSRTSWARTTTERMSAFGGLWKFGWLVKIRIHVRPKPGQPRRECQRSVACENSNSRTI